MCRTSEKCIKIFICNLKGTEYFFSLVYQWQVNIQLYFQIE